MRGWIFLLFSLTFLILIITEPFKGITFFPSVLLSYWIWCDGGDIKILKQEIEKLKESK